MMLDYVAHRLNNTVIGYDDFAFNYSNGTILYDIMVLLYYHHNVYLLNTVLIDDRLIFSNGLALKIDQTLRSNYNYMISHQYCMKYDDIKYISDIMNNTLTKNTNIKYIVFLMANLANFAAIWNI